MFKTKSPELPIADQSLTTLSALVSGLRDRIAELEAQKAVIEKELRSLAPIYKAGAAAEAQIEAAYLSSLDDLVLDMEE